MKLFIDIENIKNQIIKLYNPKGIYLFGSQATETANMQSDIDLCVVIETDNRRDLLADMYFRVECNRPFDLLLYTPDEWNNCVCDKTSFAYIINEKGELLYAR